MENLAGIGTAQGLVYKALGSTIPDSLSITLLLVVD